MKTTNYRRTIFSLAVKGCLLLIAGLVILPYPTKEQCSQWDVSGKWTTLVETHPTERLELKQSGNDITGTSFFYGAMGKVIGILKGDTYDMTVDWNTRENGSTLEFFHGKILADGTIEGTAATLGGEIVKGKDNKWTSDRPMKCIGRYKPITRLKITPTEAPAPGPPAPAAASAPTISASPNDGVFVPGKIAHTVIKWDGGPEHPYAELWVKVDDQGEKFVIEQGKGSRQMVVEPGKTYLYILTDSGKTLATVTVKFHQ